MFPELEEEVVLEVLDNSDSLDQAVNSLLQLSDPVEPAEGLQNPVSTSDPERMETSAQASLVHTDETTRSNTNPSINPGEVK